MFRIKYEIITKNQWWNLIFGFASCLCGRHWHVLGYPKGVNKPLVLFTYLFFTAHPCWSWASHVCYKLLSPLVSRWCVPTRPCPTRWASWQFSTVSTPTSYWQTMALRGSTALRSNCGVSSRSTSPFRRSTHVSGVYCISLSCIPGRPTYLPKIRREDF